MHLVLLCATRRGIRLLEGLRALHPRDRITAVSFREEPGEPEFLDAIGEAARRLDCAFVEARDVAGEAMAPFWREHAVDLMVAANWRRLVPRAVFIRPARGSVVLHDSLLPRHRGFSPLPWAVLNGETETGATLFHMSEAMDSGDIIDQVRIPIGPDDTIDLLLEVMTAAYLRLLQENLEPLLAGRASRRPQEHDLATYAARRVDADNAIDWSWPARRIHDLVRALTRPYPGAWTNLGGARLTIWRARPFPERRYSGNLPGAVAGLVPGKGALVLTGTEPLLVESVQVEGAPPQEAGEVLRSIRIRLGRPR